MAKKIIAINGGPRKGWNTDIMIQEALKGAAAEGAEIECIDLYALEKYTGCRACFACKRAATYGKCIIKDGLAPVLEKIRQADGLILGSPNYLGSLSAMFRAFYERLIFQSLTYNKEKPNANERKIPVLLITTSNVDEERYDDIGYTAMLNSYKGMLENFVGPTEILIYGDTVQVKDYSQFNWTNFNPEAKIRRREAEINDKLKKAFEKGKELVNRA